MTIAFKPWGLAIFLYSAASQGFDFSE